MSTKTFPAKLIALLQESDREQIFPKGGMILHEGEIERDIYYVVSGAIRVIYLTEFEEQTIRFGYEGSIIIRYPHF